ncbi:MAG: hypothetical protein Q8K32_31450 [Archangium sp.]|nr:hypothetical protein [Archangium sp.]
MKAPSFTLLVGDSLEVEVETLRAQLATTRTALAQLTALRVPWGVA